MIKLCVAVIFLLISSFGIAMANDIPDDTIDAINRRCYDHKAEYWNRFPFPDVLPDMVRQFQGEKGQRVIDIGSGTGVLAKWLVDRGFDVLCLDPSSEMVRRTKKKDLKTLKLRLQDFETEEKFDMAFAILSLIHVPKSDMEAEIKKISDMLVDDGMFFVGMISGDREGVEEKASGYPRFFSKYTRKDFLKVTDPYFTLQDSYYTKGRTGYFLLALKKR